MPLTSLPEPQSHFYTQQPKDISDDYAYRVTQIVDEPQPNRHPVPRHRPSKKKSRRVSTTYSISTDSGTEMAPSPRGQINRGYSRTPSSSHELNTLNVRKLNETIYAKPQRVPGQGSFGSTPHLRSHSQISNHSAATFQPIPVQRPRHHSTSSTGTFQAVDPQKRWNGHSTTIVNVDTHERHEWTDTEDNASVKVHSLPIFNHRSTSHPNLNQEQPFNYISFSQQLYGQGPPATSESNVSKSKRTVSYV